MCDAMQGGSVEDSMPAWTRILQTAMIYILEIVSESNILCAERLRYRRARNMVIMESPFGL